MSYSNFNTFKLFQNVGINSSADYALSMEPNGNNVSFHSSNSIDYNNVDIMSIKNIINKAPNEDLNLSSLTGTTINPVITINNNHSDCRIKTNLNVSGNLNVLNGGMIKTTGIGSFGSINCGVGTFTTTDINGGTIDNVTIANSTWNGTVDRAAAADKVKISSVPSSNMGYYLSMVDPQTSTGTDLFTHGSLHYNPITNTLVATNFSGSISGGNVSGNVAAADTIKLHNSNNNTGQYYIPCSTSYGASTGAHLYTDQTYLYYRPNENRIYTGSVYCQTGYNYFSGYVGCGKTPSYPLDVGVSNLWGDDSAVMLAYYNGGAQVGFGDQGSYNLNSFTNDPMFRVSCRIEEALWIAGHYIFISSDSRIKTNIVDVPDNLALQKLRSIPCRYYEYIDKLRRGSDKTIGFIAQEVKSVFPMAVTQEKQIIPNIYKVINCTWTSNNDKFIMSSTDLTNVNGVKYRFQVSNKTDASDEKMIECIGNNDNTFTFDTQYTNVFCYGSEVDDFNILDKQKLFTLNFSATQEIDRIQQTHITEIASLKTEVSTLKTEVSTLKTENQQQQNEINTLKRENVELKSVIDKLKTANSFEEFKQAF